MDRQDAILWGLPPPDHWRERGTRGLRLAPGKWALTACNGDPKDASSWRREILPVCARCNRLIGEAGREGRVLKATGERWFGGHTVVRFKAPGMPGQG